MHDERRKTLHGVTDSHDRLWVLRKDGAEYALTDYNDEITGYDPRLYEMFPTDVHYGGNAYWVTGVFAARNGFAVEYVNDR